VRKALKEYVSVRGMGLLKGFLPSECMRCVCVWTQRVRTASLGSLYPHPTHTHTHTHTRITQRRLPDERFWRKVREKKGKEGEILDRERG